MHVCRASDSEHARDPWTIACLVDRSETSRRQLPPIIGEMNVVCLKKKGDSTACLTLVVEFSRMGRYILQTEKERGKVSGYNGHLSQHCLQSRQSSSRPPVLASRLQGTCNRSEKRVGQEPSPVILAGFFGSSNVTTIL